MLLVLASRFDAGAVELVRRWAGRGARLLTCADLSTPGWRWVPGDPRASRAVVGGEVIPLREIRGVLARLPSVTEPELPHIGPADRAYVAAEMQAFLAAWLAEGPFRVANRPTPACLTGPAWRPEQWLHAAACAGLRVGRARVRIGLAEEGPPEAAEADGPAAAVTVVGARSFGPADAGLAAQARRLARRAGAGLLTVLFRGTGRGAPFVAAYPGADVSAPGAADALLELLGCARRRAGVRR